MVARISWLALAIGILVGCYDLPKPECGFACGPAGACPSDYSCNVAVNRCQLAGSTPTCASALDAGMPDSQNDFIPPMVVDRSPPPSSSGVPITATVGVTFSEQVVAATVNGNSFSVEDSNVPISGIVSYEPTTFTALFVPQPDLQPSTQYTVFVTTAIVDLAGNPLQIADVWQFTTDADLIAPTVLFRTPAINATGVGVGAPIFVDFSEPVTVPNGSFTLMQGTTPVPATIVPMAANRVLLLPTTQLAENTPYTVNLTSAIRDLAVSPNPLAPVSWMFTTGDDLQAPMVVTRTPPPASAGVLVTTTVTASFDEDVINVSGTSFTLTPMGGAPVAATIGYASATRTATLTPTVQLTASTLYTVNLTSAVSDPSLNLLTPVSWSFTTGGDMSAPNVVTRVPMPAATGTAVTTTVTASFDENVLNVTGTSFTLTPMSGSPVAATVSYAAATRTASLSPNLQLAAFALYTVNLTSAITDSASNALMPVSWQFTTDADTIGPRVVLLTPLDMATAVPTSSTIAVRFDEPVQNVTVTSFMVNGGAVTGTIALSAGNTIATFTPDAALPASATITVNLSTAITDTAANPIAALMFSFMTAP